MKIEDCKVCGGVKVILIRKGEQVGLYCAECGKWKKWVGKKDLPSFTSRGYKIYPEGYEIMPDSLGAAPSNSSSDVYSNQPRDSFDADEIVRQMHLAHAEGEQSNAVRDFHGANRREYAKVETEVVQNKAPWELPTNSLKPQKTAGNIELEKEPCSVCDEGCSGVEFVTGANYKGVTSSYFEGTVTIRDASGATILMMTLDYCTKCGRKM